MEPKLAGLNLIFVKWTWISSQKLTQRSETWAIWA